MLPSPNFSRGPRPTPNPPVPHGGQSAWMRPQPRGNFNAPRFRPPCVPAGTEFRASRHLPTPRLDDTILEISPLLTVKLDTPEDIAKWRAERRKNYPTVKKPTPPEEIKQLPDAPNSQIEKKDSPEQAIQPHARKNNQSQKRPNKADQDSGHRPAKTSKGNEKPNQRRYVPRRKPTLYEKLLLNDVQRKEDEIMKCIELIAEKNFQL